jgi:AcrR family transcriptional regulator
MCLGLSGTGIVSRGEDQLAATIPKLDPRAEKTRLALMRAFNELLLSRGYHAVMPADVAEAAGVVRSTLYEHFSGKEGMLRHSLLPILEPLAACAAATRCHRAGVHARAYSRQPENGPRTARRKGADGGGEDPRSND